MNREQQYMTVLIALLEDHPRYGQPELTTDDAATLLGVSRATALKIFRELVEIEPVTLIAASMQGGTRGRSSTTLRFVPIAMYGILGLLRMCGEEPDPKSAVTDPCVVRWHREIEEWQHSLAADSKKVGLCNLIAANRGRIEETHRKHRIRNLAQRMVNGDIQ